MPAETFDNLNPKRSVTDPAGVGVQSGPRFPAHVHKHVAEATDTSVVVAWNKKQPIHNEYAEAADQPALDALLAEGWSEKPVLEAPRRRGNGSGAPQA